MEFLRVVEEELRGLAAEARRRHPVVQEAAERYASACVCSPCKPVFTQSSCHARAYCCVH